MLKEDINKVIIKRIGELEDRLMLSQEGAVGYYDIRIRLNELKRLMV